MDNFSKKAILRLLIVAEDNESSNNQMSFLAMHNYSVKVAHNAARAALISAEFNPQIVLIDLDLNHQNGIDTLDLLIKQNPEIRCLMLSDHIEVDSALTSLRHGAVDHLNKSISQSELLLSLDRAAKKIIPSSHQGQTIHNEIIFQNAADGIFIHDEYGIIHDVNNAVLNQLHYSKEEIKSLSIFDIEIGASRGQLLTLWQSCQPENPVSVDGIQQRKDGSTFPVEVKISAYLQNDKKYLLAIARDVTQLKIIEEDLQLYQLMIETTSDPMFLIDSESSKILYVNEAAVKRCSAPREEILTWTLSDWKTSFSTADLLSHIHDIKKTPGLIIETILKVNNGEQIPVKVSLNTTKYKGRLCHFGFIHNTSIRKETEDQQAEISRQLKHQANQLILQKRAMDEHAIVSISDEKGNIIYVNDKFERISQYSRDEVIGKNHRILKSGFHPASFYHEMWKTISSGKVWHGEIKNKAKDDSEYWVKSTIIPLLNDQGNPEQYIAIRTEITYIKNLETRQEYINKALLTAKGVAEQEKANAEKASQAKTEFLSAMSHELRTPLNSILGFSQLLKNDPEKPLTADQKDSVDFIIAGGKHLLSLINEILALSAIEAGKVELSVEPIQLNDIINDSLSLINTIAEKANIEIRCLTNILVFVQADHTKLKQILLNLISNAIKYNKEGGSVSLDWQHTEDDFVRISIIDTGIGIPEKNQDKVFGAFNRLGQEKSGIEGTGVGLVVTKSLVELMAGRIGFDSQENKGTTFWFELPIGETENPHETIVVDDTFQSLETEYLDTSPEKQILYVEDNIANRRLMQSFFNHKKTYTLHFAETGEIGWEMASKQNFDLILMDIHLPDLDGKELTRRLREHTASKNIPIIAVTAAAMSHDIEDNKAIFNAYITKPIQFDILNNILKKYL